MACLLVAGEVDQEQLRLLSFIPSYLDNLRTSQPATLSDLDRHTSVISLCQNIKVFIDEAVVIDQSNDMSDLFRMQSKNESIQNLIITLKRFEFDFETMEKFKLNTYCEFSELLNVLPYTR